MTMTPEKSYQSLLFSSPDLTEGTYTIKAGETEETVEVSGVVTTAGAEGGMHGGRNGGFGDMKKGAGRFDGHGRMGQNGEKGKN